MKKILSVQTVSISELKKSPAQVIKSIGNEAAAILVHNKPSAYLLPTNLYEKMLKTMNEAQKQKSTAKPKSTIKKSNNSTKTKQQIKTPKFRQEKLDLL